MNYFTQADLKQLEATYNYTARSGLGFAITPDNEQVFVTARDVSSLNLDVGDSLRIWAADNYASPLTAHHPSRWRAVRVELVRRMDDIVRDAPSTPVAPPIAPKSSEHLNAAMQARLDLLRPWAVNEMAHDIAKARAFAGTPDLTQKVGTRLNAMHRDGNAACIKVYARGEQQNASAVYYAKNVDVFYEHLDTPLGDEE